MSCEYAALGVEYATRARLVPLVAAAAALARIPPTNRFTPTRLIRRIRLSYLSILSTDLVDNADGEGSRQVEPCELPPAGFRVPPLLLRELAPLLALERLRAAVSAALEPCLLAL